MRSLASQHPPGMGPSGWQLSWCSSSRCWPWWREEQAGSSHSGTIRTFFLSARTPYCPWHPPFAKPLQTSSEKIILTILYYFYHIWKVFHTNVYFYYFLFFESSIATQNSLTLLLLICHLFTFFCWFLIWKVYTKCTISRSIWMLGIKSRSVLKSTRKMH